MKNQINLAPLHFVKACIGVAPRIPRSRPLRKDEYFSEAELKRLFGIVGESSVRDLAIFTLALYRGLRASEVGKLTFRDLDKLNRRLFVRRTQRGNSCEHDLTRPELKALRLYIHQKRGTGKGPLFPSRFNTPISRSQLDRLMKHYGKAAGIPPKKRHFHCLRHTCGIRLRATGATMEQIQGHLGNVYLQGAAVYETNRRKVR